MKWALVFLAMLALAAPAYPMLLSGGVSLLAGINAYVTEDQAHIYMTEDGLHRYCPEDHPGC